MGMEIGARILKEKNIYGFAPENPFKNINFMDGTDMRCTTTVREALNCAGINFYEIDSFIVLPQEKVPQILEKVKQYKNAHSFSSEQSNTISSLIEFIQICMENKFHITIG